jgi:hypothetical protein
MGSTSGRSSRGDRRRAGGDRASAARHGYTSLISDTQRGGYQPDGGYGDHRGYAHTDGYGPPNGFRQPGGPPLSSGFDQDLGDGFDSGGPRAVRGQRPADGRPAAFLPGGGGRRARSRRRRRVMSVPVLSVVAVIASVAVVAAAAGVSRMLTAKTAADAQEANPNCTLIVPADPLSAQGLATPYQLTATDPGAGPCNEANGGQTAFVQGAVLDPATGKISVYNPLVVDAGTQPAVAPAVPTLPAGAVVAVWFGYNGDTLSLAGADQAQQLLGTASASPTDSAGATSTAPASDTPSQATPSDTGTGAATPTGTAPATNPADTATPAQSDQATTSPATSATAATAAAAVTGTGSAPASRAAVEAAGSAPLQPASGSASGYDGSMSRLVAYRAGSGGSHPRSSSSASASASSTSTSAPASPTTPASGSASATAGAPTDPPAAADGPAASGTPDTMLQQANCVAGENINGEFSAFTQVGACNAVAFFAAANAAIKAGKLTVPAPGRGRDGQTCMTTRSFALIDQDQSDNVTAEYLADGNGQTAQDTAANRGSLAGAATLFNGSDNGLLDTFVDPALGCTPWKAPDLADGGTPASALPLDELQAARWAGASGPAALVPLNDPMTTGANGNFSTDKTNTYRSIMDMPPLPAGQSPAAYCSDMERIQVKRLQQDVNLLIKAPSPDTGAADNLFDFLGMRLQGSYDNLKCGDYGVQNLVSTSADGNGVVVATCFAQHARPVTRGPGNPMGRQADCPATVTAPSAGAGTPTAPTTPTASPSRYDPGSSSHRKHDRHWWW